jgi:putative Mn2+ efflux pump MntP
VISETITLALIAPVLSVDNFAAAVSIGLTADRRTRFVTCIAFGGFAGAALVVGAVLGEEVARHLGTGARLLGAAFLIALGTRSLLGRGFIARGDHGAYSLRQVLAVAASVSADTFVVGFALTAGSLPLLETVTVIALVTTLASALALQLGTRVARARWGKTDRMSGAILLLAGCALLGGIA